MTAIEGFHRTERSRRAALPDFSYRVAPVMVAYKPSATHHFRLRRTIARSSGSRFRR